MFHEQKNVVWGVIFILIIATLYILYTRISSQKTSDTHLLDTYSASSENTPLTPDAETLERYSAPQDTTPLTNEVLNAYSAPQ